MQNSIALKKGGNCTNFRGKKDDREKTVGIKLRGGEGCKGAPNGAATNTLEKEENGP